jgi:hypothetical protein
MSFNEQVGEAVGRFCDTVSAQAVADPSTVGSVALSAAGVLTGGLAWWWRKRRPRERCSEVNAKVPAGQYMMINVSGDEKPRTA